MNRKLRTRIPALPHQNENYQQSVKKFKEADARVKMKQKLYFDKRHRTREQTPVTQGQTVWVKTPKTSPAKVVDTVTPRSVLVETDSGLFRRNRNHLRKRNEHIDFPQIAAPTELSVLPNASRDIPECSYNNLMGQTNQTDVQSTVHEDIQSFNSESPKVKYTKSGRKIQPPEKLSL